MSLIITSSTQDRYVDTDFAVENAHSYKNYMINSIQIPKRSAVCVQSVKFSRRGNFVIKNDDYYGYLLNSGAHDGIGDLTDKNPMTPCEFTFKPGSYTVKQFPDVIKGAIDPVFTFHPDFKDSVTETVHSAEKWDGFKITSEQKAAVTDEVSKLAAYPIISLANDEGINGNGTLPYNRPPGGVATPMWIGGFMNAQSTVPFTADTDAYEYTAAGVDAGGSVKCAEGQGTGMTFCYFPTMPISLQKGGLSFHCNKYTGTDGTRTPTTYGWISSLCRPMAIGYDAVADLDGGRWYDYGNIGAQEPALLLNQNPSNQRYGNWTQFGDFWCMNRLTDKGKYMLRVGYFGRAPGALGVAPLDQNRKFNSPFFFMNKNRKGTGGPVAAPTEIEYWKVDRTNVKTTPAAPGSAAGAYDMGLNANGYKGFRWEVSGEVVRLFAIKADDTEDYVIDISEDTIYKFPVIKQTQVRLYPKFNISDEVEGKVSSILIKTFLGRDMSTHEKHTLSIDHFGSGFYENNLGAGLKSAEVDRRGFSDPNWVYTPAPLLASDIIDYVPHYVLQPTPQIAPDFLITLPEPNIMELLGFQRALVIGSTEAAIRGGFSISSSVVPVTIAEHSLFIRCPTLTQQSLNFGKGSISKILHHIPQFDNTGKSTGALFFENAHPMYLRLGNTEEITLNEIQIDIVDRNEQYAYELDGSTIVVLHIKPESQI